MKLNIVLKVNFFLKYIILYLDTENINLSEICAEMSTEYIKTSLKEKEKKMAFTS